MYSDKHGVLQILLTDHTIGKFFLLEMKVTMIVRGYLAKINVSESANECSSRIMTYHINILYRGLPGVLWLICAMILV